MYTAVGIHVFAGGFSYGVEKQGHKVKCQLETHGFALDTANQVFGIETFNQSAADWPHVEADWAFGNPRCTGFSTITAGYGDDCHGPWSNQTQDIHQLMKYAINRYDIVIWESVQQAFSVGKPLLDYLRDEICKPNGYRVAHIMLNAASFGNSQQRKRYFFVAYKGDKNFNIEPPEITPSKKLLFDDIWELRGRETNVGKIWTKDAEYDFDTCGDLTKDEWSILPNLPGGFDCNKLAMYNKEVLPKKYQQTWDYRQSDMPFSMHGVVRLQYLCSSPTIHSSAQRFIHPELHRPLTVGELATVMGWDGKIPVGPNPVAQIAKGVVPNAGKWLARQVELYLDDAWGKDDWESSYCDKTSQWIGGPADDKEEKIFNLTRYSGKIVDREDYPAAVPIHRLKIKGRRK